MTIPDSVTERITEVDTLLQDSRRRWLLGVVAVSAAVKDTDSQDVGLAA